MTPATLALVSALLGRGIVKRTTNRTKKIRDFEQRMNVSGRQHNFEHKKKHSPAANAQKTKEMQGSVHVIRRQRTYRTVELRIWSEDAVT